MLPISAISLNCSSFRLLKKNTFFSMAAIDISIPHLLGVRYTIGIGDSGAPLLPCHTTGHAGPHPAVRKVEVGRLSQAFTSAPCPESPIAPHHFARPQGFTPARWREWSYPVS